jgi:type II secretory pathway component GspD/PulD (secretin)
MKDVDWVSLPLALVLAAQVSAQPARAGQLPTLPLTQLDDRALAADLDNRAFTLTFAQSVAIKDLLLLLVRGTSLSVIPDPAISGSFIGELKNVTVRQALDLILPPLGLDFTVDGGFIRVFKREPATRLFALDYLATERAGESRVGGGPATEAGDSFARVTSTTRNDLFGEITRGLQTLLSAQGTFNVDRKAGLVQVTDFPERLDRVGRYLDAVQDRVQRQVQIEARVLEVELQDESATTLDWSALGRPMDFDRTMAALGAQGTVRVVASPRLVVLNNEPAVVQAEGFSIGVTPQIGPDAVITLSVSPLVAEPQVSESDTIARVSDGQTIVFGGFGEVRETRQRGAAGSRGGWFGRSTVVTRKRVELVVLLTAKIL